MPNRLSPNTNSRAPMRRPHMPTQPTPSTTTAASCPTPLGTQTKARVRSHRRSTCPEAEFVRGSMVVRRTPFAASRRHATTAGSRRAIGDPAFEGLNRLVANVYSGGSIAAQNYAPSFALSNGEDSRVFDALELAGVEYTVVGDRDGRADEARPTDNGTVLGRVLSVLGAPVGPKAEQRLSLPDYLAMHRPTFANSSSRPISRIERTNTTTSSNCARSEIGRISAHWRH